MKAFILAAGFGKRMGHLTADRPKPLLQLNGQPLIFYTLFQLYRWGVKEAMINLHYLGDQIENALKEFPHFTLRFSHEPEILGTAGGVRKALDLDFLHSDEWCLLANPDSLLQPNPQDAPLEMDRLDSTSDAVLYLKPLNPEDQATGFAFSESGTTKDLIHISSSGQYYYIGYGLVRAGSVAHLPADQLAEFRPEWRTAGEKGRLIGRRFLGTVRDIGTRESYEKFQASNHNAIAPELQTEWRAFLAGWADSETT